MSSEVKSAERALQVLLLLGRSNTPLSTLQIAQSCAIPKSSAHHLVNVMRDLGFISYDEQARLWRLGPVNLEMGRAYLRSDPLLANASAVMKQLSDVVGATSHLAVLDGEEVLYVNKTEPSGNAIRLVTEAGMRLPAHVTSVGLAILANLPDIEIEKRFRSSQVFKKVESGPKNATELLSVLKKVRKDGYALDKGMVTPGIACIASAISNAQGSAVASIGVTYVTAQKDAAQVKVTILAVREAAKALSSSIAGL